jgi:uncharacterized protein with NAD-binding domain and iron-sulfur cluster
MDLMASGDGRRNVAIVGGGVAGLTAAHELSDRGYRVTVYERRPILGGKARSMNVAETGPGGRPGLPGEHGFRFFPGFYRHVPDTMSRIVAADGYGTVRDHLVDTTRELMGDPGRPTFLMLPAFPRSLEELALAFSAPEYLEGFGITRGDMLFFAHRLWQILTSCRERRVEQYERIPWWQFIDADRRSDAYRRYLGIGLTRTLVAAKAERASTKTIGDIGLQLILNMLEPGQTSDRVLDGPTNDVWIDPWVRQLRRAGVTFVRDAVLQSIACDKGVITGLSLSVSNQPQTVTADSYVLALPIEVVAPLVTPTMAAIDPTLGGLKALVPSTAWMNGVQFYLRDDVPICHGHQMYLDTPWALTSISQAQFWPGVDLADFGDGQVRGILSVDVSDWTTAGRFINKPAQDCTADEIAQEVWTELKRCLNVSGQTLLDDANRHSYFIDNDITYSPGQDSNAEPLLINEVNTWPLRPEAYSRIPNLFLASDYVRTNSDLACMEGANEAARRAVNAILDADGVTDRRCKVWDLHEPDALAAYRLYDASRYRQGLPWDPVPPDSTLGRVEHLGREVLSFLRHPFGADDDGTSQPS